MNTADNTGNPHSPMLIICALIGPFLLLSLVILTLQHLAASIIEPCAWGSMGISVIFGGLCFSRGLKRWPNLDYLLLVYLVLLPIILMAYSFFFYVLISGDGP